MQYGITIFGSALTTVFANFGAALRLTAVVWLGASLVIYALGFAMVGVPIGPMSLRPDAEGQMPALSASFSMIALVINVLATAYVMMVWSRYCLKRDTPPGAMPSLRGQPFGGVLVTVILVVAGVGAAAFLLSLIGSYARPAMPLIVGLVIFPVLMALVIIWLFFRIGAAIPASADEQIMSLTSAWSCSKGLGLWLVTILAFMTLAILSVPSLFLGGLIIQGNIASVVSSWLIVLIGTGWLVEIYQQSADREQ